MPQDTRRQADGELISTVKLDPRYMMLGRFIGPINSPKNLPKVRYGLQKGEALGNFYLGVTTDLSHNSIWNIGS